MPNDSYNDLPAIIGEHMELTNEEFDKFLKIFRNGLDHLRDNSTEYWYSDIEKTFLGFVSSADDKMIDLYGVKQKEDVIDG